MLDGKKKVYHSVQVCIVCFHLCTKLIRAWRITERINQKLFTGVARLEVWNKKEIYFSLDLLILFKIFFTLFMHFSSNQGKTLEIKQIGPFQKATLISKANNCCQPSTGNSDSVEERPSIFPPSQSHFKVHLGKNQYRN